MTCSVIASPDGSDGHRTNGVDSAKQSRPFRTTVAAIAGFLLPLQTIWIIRPGMLGGVPWPLATIGLYASDVIILIAALAGARVLFSPPPVGRGSPEASSGSRLSSILKRRDVRGWAIAILTVIAATNVWVSADPWLSAAGWIRLIAFLLAIAGILSWSASVRRAFLNGFFLTMLGHVILAFLQFATGHGFASTILGTAAHDAFVRGDAVVETASGRWLRAYGGFPHPNILGTALLVVLAAFVQRRTYAVRRRQRLPEKRDRVFPVDAAVVALCVFALVLTFSRAALLGLVILLIVLARQIETRRLAGVGAIALVAAIAVTWLLLVSRVTAAGRIEQRSIAERSSGVLDALAISAIPPFLGAGLHAMPQAIYRSGSIFNPGFLPYEAQPVHNVPLLAIAEIGWIGIALLVLALAFLFPRGVAWRWEWLALVPPLLLDHFLWSLPIGLVFFLPFVAAFAGQERDHVA